ncbi:MAG: hypothetical protein QXT97_02595 [Candidatus Diapherotrites archaeon]
MHRDKDFFTKYSHGKQFEQTVFDICSSFNCSRIEFKEWDFTLSEKLIEVKSIRYSFEQFGKQLYPKKKLEAQLKENKPTFYLLQDKEGRLFYCRIDLLDVDSLEEINLKLSSKPAELHVYIPLDVFIEVSSLEEFFKKIS